MAIIDLYTEEPEQILKEKKVPPKKESTAKPRLNSTDKPIIMAEQKDHIFQYELNYAKSSPIFDTLKKRVKILANLVREDETEENFSEPAKSISELRPEELKKEIEADSEAIVEKIALDPDDIDLTADIMVEVLDMVISGVCRWIAKDANDELYILSPKRMERLKNAIVKYMKTVKVASSPLGMLVVLMLIIMLTPILKAFKNRKKNKNNSMYSMPKEEKGSDYAEFEEVEQEDITDLGFVIQQDAA
ncbi:MAG: hypothetical protein IAE91_03360 [Ignavibacteriaceae bacterium]|nr:hypothetical protein [Ignavibacteriaceae bacterium]